MKVMFLNKAHAARVHLDTNPCKLCMYYSLGCTYIPTSICIEYGGFAPSDTKIFTL